MSPPTEGITVGWRRGAQPLRLANFTTRVEMYTFESANAHFCSKSLTFYYVQHDVKSALPDRHIRQTLVISGHLPHRRNGPLLLIPAAFTFPADCR